MPDASDFVEEDCLVCGQQYDFNLQGVNYIKAGLVKCEKGHPFCWEHSKELSALVTDDYCDDIEDPTDVDTKYCPVCQKNKGSDFVKFLTDEDLVKYFLRRHNYTRKSLLAYIKKTYKTGEEFKKGKK